MSDTAPLGAGLLPAMAAPEAACETDSVILASEYRTGHTSPANNPPRATMHPMTVTLHGRVPPSYTEAGAGIQIQPVMTSAHDHVFGGPGRLGVGKTHHAERIEQAKAAGQDRDE